MADSLQLTEEQYKKLMHSPEVVSRLTAGAQRVADLANSMSLYPGATYGVVVQNDASSSRARAFAKPMNKEAVMDDALHSTMLKAASAARGVS